MNRSYFNLFTEQKNVSGFFTYGESFSEEVGWRGVQSVGQSLVTKEI